MLGLTSPSPAHNPAGEPEIATVSLLLPAAGMRAHSRSYPHRRLASSWHPPAATGMEPSEPQLKRTHSTSYWKHTAACSCATTSAYGAGRRSTGIFPCFPPPFWAPAEPWQRSTQSSTDWKRCLQLACKHLFHDQCIRGWTLIGKKDTCPTCLEKVDMRAIFADRPWETRNISW